jgi:hypothetical protein
VVVVVVVVSDGLKTLTGADIILSALLLQRKIMLEIL